MSYHFYLKKKVCQGIKADIELTDEIKQKVLDNRIYHPPAPPQIVHNQTINNYNQNINLVRSIEPVERVAMYAAYTNTDIVDFQDSVEDTFLVRANKLRDDKVSNFQLTMDNIIDGVKEISSNENNHEKCNMIYDEPNNTIRLYINGGWVTHNSIEKGICAIIQYMKESFLNIYECYLIRKIYNEKTQCRQKSDFRDRLDDYYRFISCYDIDPFVKEANDADIMIDDTKYTSDDFDICEKIKEQYNTVKSKHNVKNVKEIKQEVRQVLQRNSRTNLENLNTTLLDMMQMDEEFKQTIIGKKTRTKLNVV